MGRNVRMLLKLHVLQVLLAVLPTTTVALGGELANYTTSPLDLRLNHRQNVCARYESFRKGQIPLRDALSGMELRPLMLARKFFEYSHETGIPRGDAGLLATMMDELATSANFTWRQSFGIMELPSTFNKTWTEMLLWGVETYDLAVYSWDQSVERMELGVSFIEPFFDGSLILIDQKDPPVDTNAINLSNWTKPFEPAVWILIGLTILMSALVYQLIEHLNDERENRSMGQWFSDNFYLSWLNFTQNFEYAPNSTPGRIFGISMGLWGLVMTATYTANLASFFVAELHYPIVVESIEQAVQLGYPICTYGNTNAEKMVKEKYPDALGILIPKENELETFLALKRGECKLVIAYKDNWLSFRGNKDYNPDCDLEWVGRSIETIKSGMAIKSDAGHKCTSLIRDVINLHMVELIKNGVLADAWEIHRAKTRNVECDLDEETDTTRRRRRRLEQPQSTTSMMRAVVPARDNDDYDDPASKVLSPSARRKLKSGGGSAAKSTSTSSGEQSLTVQQMLGTFVLHWALMGVALLVSVSSPWFRRVFNAPKGERVTYRTHGPIIGMPPPLNTYVVSNKQDPTTSGEFGTGKPKDYRAAKRDSHVMVDASANSDTGPVIRLKDLMDVSLQSNTRSVTGATTVVPDHRRSARNLLSSTTTTDCTTAIRTNSNHSHVRSSGTTAVRASDYRKSVRDLAAMVEAAGPIDLFPNHHQSPSCRHCGCASPLMSRTNSHDNNEFLECSPNGSSYNKNSQNGRLKMWQPKYRAKYNDHVDDDEDSESPEQGWREAHEDLQRKQQSMDTKMDLVLQMLQEMNGSKTTKLSATTESHCNEKDGDASELSSRALQKNVDARGDSSPPAATALHETCDDLLGDSQQPSSSTEVASQTDETK
ncbi:receptor ionotropic, NMDA 1 [Seminavis robusta]|uniref:Receptor ionotropic, NMDA 1 n=1 Tax=Seminavis robusta TaxID=568900 RepID=A0A9N8HUK6_9STRA|nr:receptor ionotropic, NMDA 1 [Seminavis robusta]|eukprot:Sro2104_g314720.1 receptor ionotropic, NMDA 1 (883) ;mRNA; r:6251-9003